MPILKDIADYLKAIDGAIAPDFKYGHSLSEKLVSVGGALGDIAQTLRKLVEAK